jgi:hypothetical protein
MHNIPSKLLSVGQDEPEVIRNSPQNPTLPSVDLMATTVSFKLAATTNTENTYETDFKSLRALKRHTKLNHPKRRRRLQYKVPDQHGSYGGYNEESLSTYDLPKSYLQGEHWFYYGLTWLYGDFGPRKRKWGTKRFTKNFLCSNVFECECKHTEKHIRMRNIKEEVNELDYL